MSTHVLGPLLFLLYINDISNSSSSKLGHFVLFADDTNIFVAGKTEQEAYLNANKVLESVNNYVVSNLLHINLSKSVYMLFRPGRYSSCTRAREYGSENSLTLSGTTLTRVNEVRFLGVIIDHEQSWEPQLDNIRCKLTTSIAIIKRIMKFIPKTEYHKLYDSLFKSHMSYCISSWVVSHLIDYLNCSPSKKDVYAFYLEANQALTGQSTMKHVHVQDHTVNTSQKGALH